MSVNATAEGMAPHPAASLDVDLGQEDKPMDQGTSGSLNSSPLAVMSSIEEGNEPSSAEGQENVETVQQDGSSSGVLPELANKVDSNTVDANTVDNSDSGSESEADSGSDGEDGGPLHSIRMRYASELRTQDLFEVYSKRLAKKKHRESSKKAPQLVRGLIDYLRVLEERILKLESQQPATDDVPAPMAEPPSSQQHADEHRIRTTFHDISKEKGPRFPDVWPEFKVWGQPGSFLSTPDSGNVVRVLYKWKGASHNLSDGSRPNPSDIDILAIRVDSDPLVEYIKSLGTYSNGPPTPPTHNTWKDHILLWGKPFRIMIRSMPALKRQLTQLEQKYSTVGIANAVPAQPSQMALSQTNLYQTASSDLPGETPPAPNASTDIAGLASFDKPQALLHFQELIDVVNVYLEKEMSIYEQHLNGTLKNITFEHLWMIFDTNDTIYCSSRKDEHIRVSGEQIGQSDTIHCVTTDVQQAYRVLATFGGTPYTGQLMSERSVNKTTKIMNDVTSSPFDLQLTEAGAFKLASSQMENLHLSKQKNKERYSPLHISCFFIDFDGKKLRTVWDFFLLRPFEGEVAINSLPVFPIQYHPNESTAKDLWERGRKFVSFTPVDHYNYDGLTRGSHQEEIRSPIMVDFQQAFRQDDSLLPSLESPNCFWKMQPGRPTTIEMFLKCTGECSEPALFVDYYPAQQRGQYEKFLNRVNEMLEEYEIEEKDSPLEQLTEALEDANLLILLPGVVYGFALRNRRWHQFDIDNISNIQLDNIESGWKDLVLPDGHRDMVQSMVMTHTVEGRSSSTSRVKSEIGLVQGKGKGCIKLLHGAPGVGKTSTAETVAAYTRRPLYPITSGDIGYEPDDVERKLEDLFRLGHRWGCVLLIDEADVFLAERDKSDVKRNGLVSVFLRVLEYYSGILFLTTNRVGAFDDAFRSRIHLTLYYPKLDETKSHKVWKTSIKRLSRLSKERIRDGLPKIAMDKEKILNFADMNFKALQWNGRQIQNAFQTALALAEFEVKENPDECPTVTVQHFSTIAKASIDFDDYLQEVHVGDSSKNAKLRRLRADNVTTSSARKIKLPESEYGSSASSSLSSDSSRSELDSDHRGESKTRTKKKSKSKAGAKAKAKSRSTTRSKRQDHVTDDEQPTQKIKSKNRDKLRTPRRNDSDGESDRKKSRSAAKKRSKQSSSSESESED